MENKEIIVNIITKPVLCDETIKDFIEHIPAYYINALSERKKHIMNTDKK